MEFVPQNVWIKPFRLDIYSIATGAAGNMVIKPVG